MANISPELLARLQASGGGIVDGVQYQPQYKPGFDPSGGYDPSGVDYWITYDPKNNDPGTTYGMFDPSGQYLRDGTMKSGNDPALLAAFLAAAGGMSAFMPGGFATGAAASGGVPGWAEYMAELGGAGGAGGGAGGAAGASSLADMYAMEQGMGAAAGGLGTTAATTASGIGSFLKGNAGLLAAGAGALAGAQGNQQSATQTKSMPEWLRPYYTGDGGLLNLTQAQLQRSQSPEALQGWQNIAQRGQGLLSMPIAPNGYAQRGGR